MSIASKLNDVFGNAKPEDAINDVKPEDTTPTKAKAVTKDVFIRKGRELESELPWENNLRVSGVIVHLHKSDNETTFVTVMTKTGRDKNGKDVVFYPQFRFFPETPGVDAFRVKDFVTIDGYVRSFFHQKERGFSQAYIGTEIKPTEPTPNKDGTRNIHRFEDTANLAGEVVSIYRTEKLESYQIKVIRNGKANFFNVVNFKHNDRVKLHGFVKIVGRLQTQRKAVDGKEITSDSIVVRSLSVLEK